MKLTGKIEYKLTIELLSGLHIGDSKEKVEIGGVDNIVVRRKDNNVPYIPGSSLKGKIRALLQQTHGELDNEKGEKVAPLFGTSKDGPTKNASRVIFRDADMTSESVTLLDNRQSFLDMQYTEVKAETAIDRITGKAKGGTLRNTERVPAGVFFSTEIILNVFEGDPKANFVALLNQGIALLNADYLGKSGSRGYGHVKVTLSEGKDLLPEILNIK